MRDDTKLLENDLAIRHFVYQMIVKNSVPPTTRDTAVHFSISEEEAKDAYQRLNDNHFFFLEPGTSSIRMANPFSAVPTPFKVTVRQKTYWANCAWDMLGIPAAMDQDTRIDAIYTDTQEPIQMHVENGQLQEQTGVVHFPLPVTQWYDDLILT